MTIQVAPFKKGQKVVKVIIGYGVKTASLATVEKVKNGVAYLGDSSLEYNAKTGQEINPVIPGFHSEIIELE